MKKFSERNGIVPPKNFQTDFLDDDIRNSLWNLVTCDFLDNGNSTLYINIWRKHFKKNVDEIKYDDNKFFKHIKELFFSNRYEWYEIYDFIEYIINCEMFTHYTNSYNFILTCNNILEQEASVFRIVDSCIVSIVEPTEIKSIEMSIACEISSVKEHMKTSLFYLTNKNKDYRNSIKESISAVEAICKVIAGDNNATLGSALNIIGKKYNLHSALRKSFTSLYGYTSDEGGIRHSLTEDSIEITFNEAKYMLVVCSAFVNYMILIHKNSR